MLIPKQSLSFRTGWSGGEHALAWQTHVSAPGSINSKRITAKPAREGFVSMCACTEPVRTDISAVCVEYDGPKWPIAMLNHTSLVQNNVLFFIFGTLCSYDPLWRGFFSLGKPRKKRLASLARLMILGNIPPLLTGTCCLGISVHQKKCKRVNSDAERVHAARPATGAYVSHKLSN